jgi:hypothetical protein
MTAIGRTLGGKESVAAMFPSGAMAVQVRGSPDSSRRNQSDPSAAANARVMVTWCAGMKTAFLIWSAENPARPPL